MSHPSMVAFISPEGEIVAKAFCNIGFIFNDYYIYRTLLESYEELKKWDRSNIKMKPSMYFYTEYGNWDDLWDKVKIYDYTISRRTLKLFAIGKMTEQEFINNLRTQVEL